MTIVNTKGMTFIGPGSEWFWAALQFTALAITFVAISRQLLVARSQHAVEQVTAYTRDFESEAMSRYQLVILVAVRDGADIPRFAKLAVSSYFETLGALSRRKHLDIKLLWELFDAPTQLWWAILESYVHSARAEQGDDRVLEDWEWLVETFRKMDRRVGATATYDAYAATWIEAGAIESFEDRIRVWQALRSVVIAESDGLDALQSAAPTRTPVPPPSTAAEHYTAAEHQENHLAG